MTLKISKYSRWILGLIYFVFGLNGFLNFIPVPPPPESAAAFLSGMMSTGYFFPVLKSTEVICGTLLLSGFAAPLALVILAPITFQIFLFHGFMTPGIQFIILPLVMLVLHVCSVINYWPLYRPLFKKS